MLGLSTLLLHPPIPIQIQQISKSLSFSHLNHPISPSSSILTLTLTLIQNPKIPKRFVIRTENNGDGKDTEKKTDNDDGGGGGGDGGDLKKDRRTVFNLKWGDLLAPDPDNLFAVALTGLLAWASVQVLGQLFFISLAILVAALKYSFIAALLVFILITLL